MPLNSLPITTPSLQLRHIVVEEAAQMMQLNGEPSTRRWLPSHIYADVAEATSRMQYLIACYSTPGDPRVGPYVLAVDHLPSRVLLGHVGFSPFDDEVEVSFAIAEASRGRGYGAEALLQACHWAAENWDLQQFVAITEAANASSRRTLERAAFVHEEDKTMVFQGTPEIVSCYVWRRTNAPKQ